MSECCSAESSRSAAATEPAAGTKIDCPRCGQAGQPVALQTLKHQVKPGHLESVEAGAFSFCRTATCDAVYFNDRGTVLTKADVRERIGAKETEDPVLLCYCFGFTEAMVRDEIGATGRCTIPQRIAAEVRTGNCACEIRNPQGSCCLGNVNSALKRIASKQARHTPNSQTNRNRAAPHH